MEEENPEKKFLRVLRDALTFPWMDDVLIQYLKRYIIASTTKECPICLLQLMKDQTAIKLPCQHFFHETCLLG
jgi:hypothetical protein